MTKVVIPDTQVREFVSLAYLSWIGNYIRDTKPEAIIQLGDFGDVYHLNKYEAGTKKHSLSSFASDFNAIDRGFRKLTKPWSGIKSYKPKLHILEGNHDGCSRCYGTRMYRWFQSAKDISRSEVQEPLDCFRKTGWTVHHFLRPVNIAGVIYSHFFPLTSTGNNNGRSGAGCASAASQLQAVSRSCTSGHKPGLDYAQHPTPTGINHGLIAGSCYTHDEDYRTPLGNTHWRGIIVKRNVYRGSYDPEFISLDMLRKQYG